VLLGFWCFLATLLFLFLVNSHKRCPSDKVLVFYNKKVNNNLQNILRRGSTQISHRQ